MHIYFILYYITGRRLFIVYLASEVVWLIYQFGLAGGMFLGSGKLLEPVDEAERAKYESAVTAGRGAQVFFILVQGREGNRIHISIPLFTQTVRQHADRVNLVMSVGGCTLNLATIKNLYFSPIFLLLCFAYTLPLPVSPSTRLSALLCFVTVLAIRKLQPGTGWKEVTQHQAQL